MLHDSTVLYCTLVTGEMSIPITKHNNRHTAVDIQTSTQWLMSVVERPDSTKTVGDESSCTTPCWSDYSLDMWRILHTVRTHTIGFDHLDCRRANRWGGALSVVARAFAQPRVTMLCCVVALSFLGNVFRVAMEAM
jgi:hypothetical protein